MKISAEPIQDKEIVDFMKQQDRVWEPIRYNGKLYLMTLQHEVFETKMFANAPRFGRAKKHLGK